MNLKQLEAFVEVAEGGSFSKAAKNLYLTQPTISAHISALEKELEVRLFVRNTKEVSLSAEGQTLYRYASQMVDLEKRIEEEFGERRKMGRQCITIAASTIPSQYLLPKILARFNEKYPGEQFKIPYRTCKAAYAACDLRHLMLVSHSESMLRDIKSVYDLYLVYFTVAADESCDIAVYF